MNSTRYSTLGEAIAAVPQDLTETTVVLYSDITSVSKVNILEGQNVVLNMNGCKLTSNVVSGYAIDIQDSGKLVISNGVISVENAGGIRVQDGGVCKISDMEINVYKNAII